jgi:CBS domain containing-hemolysin-like protein
MFDFSDAVAKDIMVPRVNMVTADFHTPYAELMDLFRENMYTRIPIYEDSPDNIIGVLNVKDMLFIENPDKFHLTVLRTK